MVRTLGEAQRTKWLHSEQRSTHIRLNHIIGGVRTLFLKETEAQSSQSVITNRERLRVYSQLRWRKNNTIKIAATMQIIQNAG